MSTPPSQDETSVQPSNEDDAYPPMRTHDGSLVLNERGGIVYRSQYLSTHPLRKDCMEKLGDDGRRLTYMTGDSVIRIMNAAFGHAGWGTEIRGERQVMCERNVQGLWSAGYVVTLRVSLKDGGVSHEDCGTGEGVNESKMKAIDVAFKSAVTDAMKRAARHFGERLGNALYAKGSDILMAPQDNRTALRMLEQSEAEDGFGGKVKLGETILAAGHQVEGMTFGTEARQGGRLKEIPQNEPFQPSTYDTPGGAKSLPTGQPGESVANGRGFAKASEVNPSMMVTPNGRPVSSDGSHRPTTSSFPRYAPLGDSSNRTSLESQVNPNERSSKKRQTAVLHSNEEKRQKGARNPYDRR